VACDPTVDLSTGIRNASQGARWVVERSFAWAARFRRLAKDYERLDTTLKGLHLLAFATLMLRNIADTLK
jgi:transposase